MFAKPSSPSELEQLITKATDPTLTNDNWQYILDVCDKISSSPEDNTKQAIRILTTKLYTKDANVILRTLSLVTAVSENCGSRMKQEIATKSFLFDCLIKKLSDKKLHKAVKFKITEVISQLNKSFKSDPSLKPMNDAYNTIMSDYRQFVGGADESFGGVGPSKPAKQEMRKEDKAKEEEDLQRVLKLSLQEYEREQAVKKAYLNDKPLPETKPEPKQTKEAKPEDQTIATVSKVRALYDLISYEPDELSFRKGDVITVIESVYRDWWRGSLPSGKVGIFPLNYVTPIINKTPDQLQKEVEEEDHLLAVDTRKVDKLLGLLSMNSDISEDEVTRLYNEILPLRPSLANYIEKYSVRKEELLAMNGQLNGQVKYFNELVDKLINLRINHVEPQYTPVPYPMSTHQNHTGSIGQVHQSPSRPPTGQPMSHQPTGQPTGPPTGQILGHPTNPQYGGYSNYLAQQPTSSGFGNAYQYSQNNQPPQPYLNINNFPSVNEL